MPEPAHTPGPKKRRRWHRRQRVLIGVACGCVLIPVCASLWIIAGLGGIILGAMVGYMFYSIFLGPCSLLRSHKDIMRYMRQKNAKKGITMRPGWWYGMPGGREVMSPTGRKKDAIWRDGKSAAAQRSKAVAQQEKQDGQG